MHLLESIVSCGCMQPRSSSRSPRRVTDTVNCLFCGRGNCNCDNDLEPEPTLSLPCLLGNLSIVAQATAIDDSEEEEDDELQEDMSSEDMKRFIQEQNAAMVKLLGGKIDGVAERVEVLETGQKSLNDRVQALEVNAHVAQTSNGTRDGPMKQAHLPEATAVDLQTVSISRDYAVLIRGLFKVGARRSAVLLWASWSRSVLRSIIPSSNTLTPARTS